MSLPTRIALHVSRSWGSCTLKNLCCLSLLSSPSKRMLGRWKSMNDRNEDDGSSGTALTSEEGNLTELST